MYIYDLLIFVGCLVLHVQCQTICKKDEYTVVNGSSEYCFKCATCHHGWGLYPLCGERIQQIAFNPDCKECPAGEEFSDELDSAPCHSCQKCAEHEVVTAPCTSQSNTICNGTCEAGYFFSKIDSTHKCRKCSYCCVDGKDEEIPECANQGLEALKQHCSPRPDKDCSPGSPSASPTDHPGGTENGGPSNKTIVGIVLGAVGGAIVILALAITGICLYRRRKKKEARSAAQIYATKGPTADLTVQIDNPSCTQSNNAAGSQERHHAGTVERQDINGAISGLYTANEQANQNATHSSLPKRNNLSEPYTASVNFIVAEDNTCDFKSGGSPTALPVITEDAPPAGKEPFKDEAAASDLKDNISGGTMRKCSRQVSRDSQRSGDSADAESGRWIRSPSTSSFTETLRRISSIKKDEPLVANEQQDTDGSQEAIKVIEEPSSQKIKERAKVDLVFKCKARGNSKLTYQWYKDGAELQGKDESTLVLKSVTLPDFGCYKCVARVKDSSSASVESEAAELDVTPRDGTRYKCLKNVDIDTQDLIGGLLTQTSSIVAGWRQIAIKRGMDHRKIKSLENDPEAGKKTLEYLGAADPDLTVYDFCKTLKNIRRLDIVKELLEHLSVPRSSKVYV